MIITCNNILTLPHLERMKIVAGRDGLDRIISWVHVVENPEHSAWLKGGELLLISGINIKGDLKALLDFIKDIHSRNVAGVVINVGPYIESVPKEVIDLGDSLNFPIFELPFEVKFIDISQSVCRAIFMSKIEQESMESFIEDIIYTDSTVTDDVLNRAILYGYKPEKSYYSFFISINNFETFVKNNQIAEEEKILQIKQRIQHIIIDIMNRWNKKSIYTIRRESVILIFPINKKDKVNSIAEEIVNNIRMKIQGITVNIGIGRPWSHLKDFRKSVHEAQKALKILKIGEKKDSISNYSDMGIYRLFFEIDKYEEMKELYHETLDELINYDLKNSTNLVDTLEAYIEEGGNLTSTSKRLFIHKNTVKYRVKRIEEILGCDLRNIKHLFNFSIALKIGKFLKSI